jgi:hypothetical protein
MKVLGGKYVTWLCVRARTLHVLDYIYLFNDTSGQN